MRELFAYGVIVTLLLVIVRVRVLPDQRSRVMRVVQGEWLRYDRYFVTVNLLVKAVRVFVYSLVVLTAVGLLFSTPDTGLSSVDTFVAGVVAVATTYQLSIHLERGYVETLAFLRRTREDYLRGHDTEAVSTPVVLVVYTVLFAAGLGGGLVSATLLFPLPVFTDPAPGARLGLALVLLVAGFVVAVYDVFA
jgi:hypothetical protein